MFLAYVNRIGTENGMRFVGGSRILAPDGGVLAQADESGETLLRAILKAGDLRRARAFFIFARFFRREKILMEYYPPSVKSAHNLLILAAKTLERRSNENDSRHGAGAGLVPLTGLLPWRAEHDGCRPP